MPKPATIISAQEAAEAICVLCRGIEGFERYPVIQPERLMPEKYWHQITEGYGNGAQQCAASAIWNIAKPAASPVAGVSAEKCYLCDAEILQVPGQEFTLRREKGSPITVCENCYEDAANE